MNGVIRVSMLSLLLGAIAVGAAESPIRLPDGPAPEKIPAPVPVSGSVKLTSDTLYMFDVDVDVLVLTSPEGLVSITEEAGPVKVRGKFAEDPSRTQTRTFKGKKVYTAEPLRNGTVEILVVPTAAPKASNVVRRTIDVNIGNAPQPPPVPPDVKPGPDVKPVVGDVGWVIVIEEKDKRTPEIAAVLNDTNYWTGLAGRGISFRFYDQNSPSLVGKNYLDYTASDGSKVSYVTQYGLPYVLFLDKTGKKLSVNKMPLKTSEIDALLGKGGVK